MMFDGNLLESFSSRVKENLETYDGKYDTTALLCSFTGLLSVIDEEVRKELFKNATILDEYITKANKESKEKNGEYFSVDTGNPGNSENEQTAFMRHMRNSLCHFKLESTSFDVSCPDREILSITFKDYNHKNKCKFVCTLTIDEIKALFTSIIDHIEECLSKSSPSQPR